MRTFLLSLLILGFAFTSLTTKAQSKLPKAHEILERSLAFHDPQGNWEQFKGTIYLQGKLPDKEPTYSVLTFFNKYSLYKVTRRMQGKMITRGVAEGACFAQIDGKSELSMESIEMYNLGCEEILKMRNYHMHLVGLPMKLLERGITVEPNGKLVQFNGKPTLEITIWYHKSKDKGYWQYYFCPDTYELKGYSYSPQKDGKNIPGDFVVLEEVLEIDGIKLPKVRKWYNASRAPIGTDELMAGKYLREADRMVISRGN